MKKLAKCLLFIILAAATVTALSWWISLKPVTITGNLPEWYGEQRVGGYHIHTKYSHDSDGEPAEVLAAAKVNGLSFVMITDHNNMGFDKPYMGDGVLVVPAVENSTDRGHMVSLRTARPLNGDEKKDPVAAAHNIESWAIAAHPTALKRPWDSDDFSKLEGMEIASNSSDFYRLILPNNWGRLLLALPAMWLSPPTAVSLTANHDDAALAIFDRELAAGHQILPFCGIDAHRHFPYEWELSTYQLVTYDKWYIADNPVLRNALLHKSLEAGDYYCRSGYLGDIRMDFKANLLVLSKHGGTVNHKLVRSFTATVAPQPAYPLEFRLYRNGSVVTTQSGSLDFKEIAPGAYRLEVWAKLPGVFGERPVPLFYSGGIILE